MSNLIFGIWHRFPSLHLFLLSVGHSGPDNFFFYLSGTSSILEKSINPATDKDDGAIKTLQIVLRSFAGFRHTIALVREEFEELWTTVAVLVAPPVESLNNCDDREFYGRQAKR